MKSLQATIVRVQFMRSVGTGEWIFEKTVSDIKILHSSLTSLLYSGGWSVSRRGRYTSGKEPPVPIEQGAGWAPEVVGRLAPAGNRTSDRPARDLVTILTTLSQLLF